VADICCSRTSPRRPSPRSKGSCRDYPATPSGVFLAFIFSSFTMVKTFTIVKYLLRLVNAIIFSRNIKILTQCNY